MNNKYSDLTVLAVLGIAVMNWNTIYSGENLIVIITFLLGATYIVIASNKKASHYRLILGFLMLVEVVPAFLLKGKLSYTVAAIILVILFIVKQFYDSKQRI